MFFALTVLTPWVLGCSVSNACCCWFVCLNKLRNEFADSCPCLHKWLRICCVQACGRCDARCGACCRCRRRRGAATTTASRAAASDATKESEKRDLEMVVTMQPEASEASQLEDGLAERPSSLSSMPRASKARSAFGQFRLLLWKIATVKSRSTSATFKQVVCPALVFGVVWMLYITVGITGMGSACRWNKNNRNFVRKNGNMHDYSKGQFLSHGFLETLLAFVGFIPFIQVVTARRAASGAARAEALRERASFRGPLFPTRGARATR